MIGYIEQIATSPLVIGAMMLLLNVGSRYVVHEFSNNDEEYSQNILLRRITVFAVCFVGTRDLISSIILTAAFVILAGGLFRGKGDMSREGMHNPPADLTMRVKAGLGSVDQPAYDKEQRPMFG
jgi:hypothetical protein